VVWSLLLKSSSRIHRLGYAGERNAYVLHHGQTLSGTQRNHSAECAKELDASGRGCRGHLFGDDEGAADTARDLGIRHEPHVERSEYGAKRLDYMFTTARAIARHEILCYINCDIILIEDFCCAIERIRTAHQQFLMVGRRWDVDISRPWEFRRPNWQARLRGIVREGGRQRSPEWIDYFAFTRGLYGSSIPPFVVGRVHWDHWLVWKALDLKARVVDVSAVVMAVHQNHDYSYHGQGKHGVWNDEEAGRNHHKRLYWSITTRYARHVGRVLLFDGWLPIYFFLVGTTRPLRRRLRPRTLTLRRWGGNV
jgi:hypothetical protein